MYRVKAGVLPEFTANSTLARNNLSPVFGFHTRAEADRAGSFNFASSSWIMHCHG